MRPPWYSSFPSPKYRPQAKRRTVDRESVVLAGDWPFLGRTQRCQAGKPNLLFLLPRFNCPVKPQKTHPAIPGWPTDSVEEQDIDTVASHPSLQYHAESSSRED